MLIVCRACIRIGQYHECDFRRIQGETDARQFNSSSCFS